MALHEVLERPPVTPGFASSVRFLIGPAAPLRRLWPRWLWLRALGLIFCSAFYSLLFQIGGLIGPGGIRPAGVYLGELRDTLGWRAFWDSPTLLWLGSGDRALLAIAWIGLIASILLVLNIWPRAMIAICWLMLLSFVSSAQEFSSYQSDGMLLEAAFVSWFFAPRGLRPGLGENSPPSRASLFLLQWEWFRIYFESGFVKLASHDPQWRSFTALDHYFENQPLPDWIGWYAQQFPHPVLAAVALLTLVMELGIVWMMFLPRRYRILCFLIVTPFQIGIILTSNLAFLNYFVLALGFLLLDDPFLEWLWGFLKRRARRSTESPPAAPLAGSDRAEPSHPGEGSEGGSPALAAGKARWTGALARSLRLAGPAFFLSWIFYDTTLLFLLMVSPVFHNLPTEPIAVLEPFRIANRYGLFAVMTTERYEIEFQGSQDGKNWQPYPFRYKPQDPRQPPKIFAPMQPRFDWNLWFASLGNWRENTFVVQTEEDLLRGSPSVLALFAGNPFPGKPPRQVRAVMWQYWFTNLATKRAEGRWWNRKLLGLYAPSLEREPDGSVQVTDMPGEEMPPSEPGQ